MLWSLNIYEYERMIVIIEYEILTGVVENAVTKLQVPVMYCICIWQSNS